LLWSIALSHVVAVALVADILPAIDLLKAFPPITLCVWDPGVFGGLIMGSDLWIVRAAQLTVNVSPSKAYAREAMLSTAQKKRACFICIVV